MYTYSCNFLANILATMPHIPLVYNIFVLLWVFYICKNKILRNSAIITIQGWVDKVRSKYYYKFLMAFLSISDHYQTWLRRGHSICFRYFCCRQFRRHLTTYCQDCWHSYMIKAKLMFSQWSAKSNGFVPTGNVDRVG